MPGWSEEIAKEFVRLAKTGESRLDQMQLQKLVYIAHGWCLAATGYANGVGEGRDIPHRLVADQFCEFAHATGRELAS